MCVCAEQRGDKANMTKCCHLINRFENFQNKKLGKIAKIKQNAWSPIAKRKKYILSNQTTANKNGFKKKNT